MKASIKVLCRHFSYDFDSVEPSLSLSYLLLLEHPQTMHSLSSMRRSKLPHPDAFTQVPTRYLYFSIILWESCSLSGKTFSPK